MSLSSSTSEGPLGTRPRVSSTGLRASPDQPRPMVGAPVVEPSRSLSASTTVMFSTVTCGRALLTPGTSAACSLTRAGSVATVPEGAVGFSWKPPPAVMDTS